LTKVVPYQDLEFMRDTIFEICCTLPAVYSLYPVSCILSSVFMQNKPKVKDTQMNLSSFMKRKYEKVDIWLNRKTNPIQTQFKPNQSQFKPNSRKAKNERK
jgi:hypothetical protein